MRLKSPLALGFLLCASGQTALSAPANLGYYRFPALRGNTLVFTAQGDLWKVNAQGGNAQALTSHPGEESNAAISPDGTQVAFSAAYEGPQEVYLMPIEGGLPTRLTYEGGGAIVTGWTAAGKILYATEAHSTLPDTRLYLLDPKTRARIPMPLSQASEGVYDSKGDTLYFTRQAFQGSHTRRYQGGTAQNIWKYTNGAKEAVPLTAKYLGTSKAPMWWNKRVYFLSDRDGTMNLWSMNPEGGDLKQLTHQTAWDIQSPSLDNGRIAYQAGADLCLLDIATGKTNKLDITISSDFDQTRERWITNPMQYLTSLAFAPDGSRVALTSRGRVFVVPTAPGRLVEATRKPGIRYRNALFSQDSKAVVALADESGEMEWWTLPTNGVGERRQVTAGSSVLPVNGVLSPDGKTLAAADKNQDLWLINIADGKRTKIAASTMDVIGDLRWSPDSQWLAFTMPIQPFSRIMLYSMKDGKAFPITTERADSSNPTWAPDGKWLYFLSNRSFHSTVSSPWGARQPEPYFDHQTKIYQLALVKGLRSPFLPNDELQTPPAKPKDDPKNPPVVTIDTDGLASRLREVPLPAGNYDGLTTNGSRLFFQSAEAGQGGKFSLMALDITNEKPAAKPLMTELSDYEMAADGKRLLIVKNNALFTADAGTGGPINLDKPVDLSGWTFSVEPREEWREILTDAWRMERDYFYDRKMHGVDWPAALRRFLPLVERVRDRAELADIEAQMISELSALHMFVGGGDIRRGADAVGLAGLGAEWQRAEAGGYRIERIYEGDPDYPESLSPLAMPEVGAQVGDVIQAINGVDALSVPDAALLLRNQAGKQTLLRLREAKTGKIRDCVATPMNGRQESDLRYRDWEMSRRRKVEEAGKSDIGYVHLRAMGGGDMAAWERDYYPVFNRSGLIIDMRHNNGGNIDSWILEKLLRRAWFYWQERVGEPTWNMQWAFRGHLVVLCDEHTASDGEAFTEGFRRLGLGKVIGTRTWGGEIWLSFNTTLVDGGIATAAQTGVYGPEGKWLIEGHGVEPDMVVDNLPHATYLGEDAQLDAAIATLQKQIKAHPIPVPPPPAYPNKSGLAKP